MKRLTPQEFLEKWKDENAISFCYAITCGQIAEIAKLYAEHLEETAWVSDESLPPKEDEEGSIVVELLVLIEPKFCDDKKRVRTGYYDFEEKRWCMTFADESISFEVFAWRHLPNPPKTL